MGNKIRMEIFTYLWKSTKLLRLFTFPYIQITIGCNPAHHLWRQDKTLHESKNRWRGQSMPIFHLNASLLCFPLSSSTKGGERSPTTLPTPYPYPDHQALNFLDRIPASQSIKQSKSYAGLTPALGLQSIYVRGMEHCIFLVPCSLYPARSTNRS